MKRKNKLPELLAPAGNFECLVAAVSAGADAVYVGGKRFGARAYAKNFDLDELKRAVAYCHIHNVKLYVTVNTLIEDIEMREVVEYAAELYRIGIDALIAADLGAIREIRKYVPDLEIHASTQMSVHNTDGADEAYRLGCSRVVLARELSLSDISLVTERCKSEVEVFLHGALCVCYSGQCLFSSMVGGRSGNRGECAQPCRLPYNNGKYPLSLKDLSLAGHVRELISCGVASLKIEGRMKSAGYVYTVTKIYRRLLDEGRDATAEEMNELRRAFSRGGFTDGYLTGKIKSGMTGVRADADKEESRAISEIEFLPNKVKARAKVLIKRGEPSEMTLVAENGREARAVGPVPNDAIHSPLTSDEVKARLSKMGNTFISLSADAIDLVLDEGLNLSPGALNALRREAAAALEGAAERELDLFEYALPEKRPIRTQGFDTAVFLGDCEIPDKSDVQYPFRAGFASVFRADLPDTVNGIYIPPIITEGELQALFGALDRVDIEKRPYALVSNLGHIAIAKKYGFKIVIDFRLNVTNRAAAKALLELGAEHIILSPELTLPKCRDIGGGVIVYGRIPLMITERCFICENYGCSKCSSASLVDRKGEKFPIVREYQHRNLILNSAITYMGDRQGELAKSSVGSRHFIFSTERSGEIKKNLSDFVAAKPLKNMTVRRVGRRKSEG
ncbi:MAG: DUF3656 domain-containing protein [Clostridia bacterium]|nr:DUF3656 domain-containing protein [Clostridia bacterium]